jgi:dipeptidyl aminopeptidase/acylaminoacyl peptidase
MLRITKCSRLNDRQHCRSPMRSTLSLLALMLAGCATTEKSSMSERTIAPYGSWPSPISAASLAEADIALSDLRVYRGSVYWRESRPQERGRQVLMRLRDGQISELTPTGFDVRSRVHEYGGNAYVVFDGGIVFVNFADQRLYFQGDGAAPVAVTPSGYQYADGSVDAAGRRMLWVREDHRPETTAANGEERNEIVALPLPPTGESAGSVWVTGSDFVAHPRLSADGTRLAWIEWNHPSMPWERTRLKTADVDKTGLHDVATLIDDAKIAALEPTFVGADLYAVADVGDWWNLHRWRGGLRIEVAPMAREWAGPMWTLGVQSYAANARGEVVARTSRAAVDEIGIVSTPGAYRRLDLPYQNFGELAWRGDDRIVAFASAVDDTGVLIEIDAVSGAHRVLHQPSSLPVERAYLSVPRAIEFPSKTGTAHAWFYPPTHPKRQGAAGSKPPLIVTVHGGPTSVAKATLNLSRQYWTSRGFALVDVNYGGSTSFGRAYRERLNGQWGIVDVDDAIAAVDYLVAQGLVDADKLAIRGGSAGGFTALSALAFHDRFKAATNLFGVSDIAGLAATSHKFERKYDVSLIGEPDEALYRARSPLYHLEGFTEPLLTLQGSEDKVVPPEQSRMIVAALEARGVPHAYIEFAGEQHGFRQAANIVRAQEAELYFYSQIFGFTPAEAIEPVEIRHWPRGE